MARIFLHDFAGHPFQVELSRELARRGHRVTHTYCGDYISGKGDFVENLPSLLISSINVHSRPNGFDKYGILSRTRYEFAFGRALRRVVNAENPEILILCNTPVFVSTVLLWPSLRVPIVYWHQDVYWMGIRDELGRRFGRIGRAIGRIFAILERRLLRESDYVIPIGDGFTRVYRDWNIDLEKVTVIPNWAPLDKIRPRERNNPWALANAKSSGLRLVYSGTLGRKHNPQLLLALVEEIRQAGHDASLVVVSEGFGADSIAEQAAGLPYVQVLPFQEFSVLPDVLGSADLLVAILEPEASEFSIPSKVLSYLAAGRACLGLMPSNNAAAQSIVAAGGAVQDASASGVRKLAAFAMNLTPDDICRLGQQSRQYAEAHFDLGVIAEQFELILLSAIEPRG